MDSFHVSRFAASVARFILMLEGAGYRFDTWTRNREHGITVNEYRLAVEPV